MADFEKRFVSMEEWGTGYRRVTEACRVGGYPAPEWQELGSVTDTPDTV
jgi:predicted HTH transcriptional regulator